MGDISFSVKLAIMRVGSVEKSHLGGVPEGTRLRRGPARARGPGGRHCPLRGDQAKLLPPLLRRLVRRRGAPGLPAVRRRRALPRARADHRRGGPKESIE